MKVSKRVRVAWSDGTEKMLRGAMEWKRNGWNGMDGREGQGWTRVEDVCARPVQSKYTHLARLTRRCRGKIGIVPDGALHYARPIVKRGPGLAANASPWAIPLGRVCEGRQRRALGPDGNVLGAAGAEVVDLCTCRECV